MTYPATAPDPLALGDVISPQALNGIDALARAVQAKLGADGARGLTTVEHRTNHLAIAASGEALSPDPVTLWEREVEPDTAVTIDALFSAVNEDGDAAVGYGIAATARRTGAGDAAAVGAATTTFNQAAGFVSPALTVEVSGSIVRVVWSTIGLSPGKPAHWTLRGTVAVAKLGGM